MTNSRKCRLILKAIRAGLATNERDDPSDLDPTGYLFDLPGGITVDICINQTSLQTVAMYDRKAIGGPRMVRKVLLALRAAGYSVPATNNPWADLADEVAA